MYSREPLVDSRSAAFARLVSRVLEMLNEAVEYRGAQHISKSQISAKIGCHKSQISRVLNGTTKNITLKTISDLMWATDYEPQDFRADPIENISDNFLSLRDTEIDYFESFTSLPTKTIRFEQVANTHNKKSHSIEFALS